MVASDKPTNGDDRSAIGHGMANDAPCSPALSKPLRTRAEACRDIAKQALVYISENTLDKWSRLKANEALDRIREIENA